MGSERMIETGEKTDTSEVHIHVHSRGSDGEKEVGLVLFGNCDELNESIAVDWTRFGRGNCEILIYLKISDKNIQMSIVKPVCSMFVCFRCTHIFLVSYSLGID